MRILHVYKDYYPILGGIENHIKILGEAQADAGHTVTVLVTNPNGESSQCTLNGVKIIRARRLATVTSTPVSLELPLQLWKTQTDIVHLHFPYPLGEISQLVFGKGSPYVITYHSDVINPRQQRILRLYEPILKLVLRRSDRILATSPNYIDSSRYLKPISDRCNVVPLGIDPDPFSTATPLLEAQEIPTLLFMGRLRYYKGLDYLLEALTEVKARLIVGGNGPMRTVWQKKSRELKLTNRVVFLGDVSNDDLPRLYASADIFALPATMRSEAFGTVLLEAMAAGLPCVTTELGTGTSYVVQDGITGLIVPPKDSKALSEALNRLIDKEELRKRFGNKGKRRVRENFTLNQMVTRIENIYQNVLQNERI